MSDSAALEFTLDNQISRTFRSVDLSQLVIQMEERSTEKDLLQPHIRNIGKVSNPVTISQ